MVSHIQKIAITSILYVIFVESRSEVVSKSNSATPCQGKSPSFYRTLSDRSCFRLKLEGVLALLARVECSLKLFLAAQTRDSNHIPVNKPDALMNRMYFRIYSESVELSTLIHELRIYVFDHQVKALFDKNLKQI